MSIASLGPRATVAPRHRGHRAERGARSVAAPVRTTVASTPSPASTVVLSWLRRLGTTVLWAAMALAIATFAFLAIGPHVLGYRTATMLTGSMEPGISPGDVVVSVPRPVQDVAVGDVISYHIPVEDHRVETHRVVEVTPGADGRPVVVTKGDANPNKDPWTAHLAGDTVWQQVAVVPHLGEVVQLMRSPLVQTYVFWGGLGALMLLVLSMIWRKDAEEETQTEAEGSSIVSARSVTTAAGGHE